MRFLPLYLPDFNLIELTFSVLKSWIKRYYHFTRRTYSNFSDFLRAAIIQSRCDRFARQQFRHAAGGAYIEQKELKRLREQLTAYERREINLVEGETEKEAGESLKEELDKNLNEDLNESLLR